MGFEIVTDSCANLPEDIIEENNVHVLSLSFLVDGEAYFSYEKGKKTDLAEFYQMMRDKKEITTSLVNVEQMISCFEPILQQGKDICICVFLPD